MSSRMTDMKLEITVSISPMLRYTRYRAECDFLGETHTFESVESLRHLLCSLKMAITLIWHLDLYGHRIIGDFDESDMTADDIEAWETPLAELRI